MFSVISFKPVVSVLAPFFSPRIFNNPVGLVLLLSVADNQNSVIKHERLTEDLERMGDSMTIELEWIGIYS